MMVEMLIEALETAANHGWSERSRLVTEYFLTESWFELTGQEVGR